MNKHVDQSQPLTWKNLKLMAVTLIYIYITILHYYISQPKHKKISWIFTKRNFEIKKNETYKTNDYLNALKKKFNKKIIHTIIL